MATATSKLFLERFMGCFRKNKRYFYHNQQTGESQWEYPQPDVIRSDEAMDICTTPPPPPEDEQPVEVPPPPPIAPPPPIISRHSPSPPPPPSISVSNVPSNKLDLKTIELPQLPSHTKTNSNFSEPLPPGVDYSELAQSTPPPPPPSGNSVNTSKTDDTLGQELNFFYSDIAALESKVNNPSVAPPTAAVDDTVNTGVVGIEEPLKKKKKKVKIAPGLSLKKKGVSKLVEKWKNVQKDLKN